MVPFTQTLWDSIRDVYQSILKHPFIRGLVDGSLDERAFRYYVMQDALYLRDYGRGLAVLGAKAPRDEWLMMFAEHARDALVVERALHESFFQGWGLDAAAVYDASPAPYNLLYTSYLLRTAYERPFAEVLGAFLPCYWIYWEVGKDLERQGSSRDLFQRWITTYASEEFGTVVNQVLAVMNEVSLQLNEEEKTRVRRHFVTTSKMEYLFWDMGYRGQTWPV